MKKDIPTLERRMQLDRRKSVDLRLSQGWTIERHKNGINLIPPKHLRHV